jgi:uncharacterized membrane protein YkoI
MVHRSLASGAALLLLAVPASGQSQANQNVTVKEDRPGLLAQAIVRPDAALRTALARVSGGRVKEAEIEVERRRLVYSFELAVPGVKGVREVVVDAKTGAVLDVKDEDDDTDEDTDDDTDQDTDEKTPRARGATKTPATSSLRRR